MNRNWVGAPSFCVVRKLTHRTQGYKWKAGMQAGDDPSDPCSIWFPGDRPFQAPEVNNIANWVMTLPSLVGFLDLRSYGQMRTCLSRIPCLCQLISL